MPALRFGVLDVPDAPFAELTKRWEHVEELGFDFLFVADHYRHTRRPKLPWFDGWTALAAIAEHTHRVRIGPLVANPVLRHPAIIAKAAAAIDDLSQGRLELAIGKGVEEFDHMAVGEPYWSPSERSGRFRECVAIVDGLLQSAHHPFSFEGALLPHRRYDDRPGSRASAATPDHSRRSIALCAANCRGTLRVLEHLRAWRSTIP